MGSNGVWCASGLRDGEKPDWGFMGDCLDDPNGYPATEKRYWVEAEIEIPSEDVEPVKGEVSLANS